MIAISGLVGCTSIANVPTQTNAKSIKPNLQMCKGLE